MVNYPYVFLIALATFFLASIFLVNLPQIQKQNSEEYVISQDWYIDNLKTKKENDATQDIKNTNKFVNISVLVPLTINRIQSSLRLLESIKNNTKFPKEIIFSLSGTNEMPTEYEKFQNIFNLKIILSKENKNAAENRNIAACEATMPILAFLDSDDIAGPQWIELLEYYYENTNAFAIVHKWFACSKGIPNYDDKHLSFIDLNKIFPPNLTDEEAFQWSCCPKKTKKYHLNFDDTFTHPWFAHGHISFRKEIFENIQQRENKIGQEDSYFVSDILQKGYPIIAVEQKLTGYCKY